MWFRLVLNLTCELLFLLLLPPKYGDYRQAPPRCIHRVLGIKPRASSIDKHLTKPSNVPRSHLCVSTFKAY